MRGRENKADAEAAWHRLMASPVATAGESVAGAAESFLAAASASLKPSTVGLYRRHLDRLKTTFAATKLDAVTPAALARWLHGLGPGETTKAITLRSVSAFFGWCLAQRLVRSNPAASVPKPRARSRGAGAVIPADTHARLLAVASPTLRPVLVLLHATGARPGEVCRITAADLDADSGTVRIAEHKTDHSGRPRLLFVSGDALALLRGLAAKYPSGPLLRTARGTGWTPKAVAGAVLRLCRRAGEKVTAYGYRHSFATDALAAGVPDAQVAALLGHGSTAMLHRHYSHLSSRTKVLAAAARAVR